MTRTDPPAGDQPVGWELGPDDRTQPAGRLLALVLDGYLQQFRSHEAGVRSDEDPEELHDYRVALRRTRSLLAAGKQVFPAEELELLRALTAWLAGVTSSVRDLDVLAEDLPALTGRVAPELADGTPPLTAALAARRADAYGELMAVLDGDRLPVLIRRWRSMASVYRIGGSEAGPDAVRPAGEVVDGLILGSYRRMRKRGKAAMASDDREQWHDLRKALKRFRYLVAAFSPMYEPDAFRKVSKRLSDLQDTLGRLQDHHVQAAIIEEVGVAVGGRAALVAGALADGLHRDAEVAHAHCRDAWKAFDTPKIRSRVEGLLRS
jgi:CHAD domain-containing protein